MEIGNLPDKEFKVMIIKILNSGEEQINMVRSLTKRKYKEPNRAEDIIIGIKIHQKESAVDSDGTEEQISKLEEKVVEIIQDDQKNKNEFLN